MQLDVVIGILFTLLNKRKVTREFLSQKYEISPRTVTRCVAALAAAGLPVVSKNGIKGGVTIADDFRMDASFFTQRELNHLSGLIKADADASLFPTLTDKLENLSKLKKSDEAVTVKSGTIVIDGGNFSSSGALREKIKVLTNAADSNMTINFKYIDRYDSQSLRKVDPYKLVLRDNIWYLYGYCRLRQAFRLFKLSRIKNLRNTGNRYLPINCNAYDALDGMFETPMTEIQFQFSNTVLEKVEEWLGFEAVSERGLTYFATATVADDSVTFDKLLSFGSSITLISPEKLKNRLLREAQLTCGKY